VLANAAPVTVLGTSGGWVLKVDSSVMTDHNGASARGVMTRSRFWFNAADAHQPKKALAADVVFESITDGGEVTARMYAADSVAFTPRDTQDYQPMNRSMQDYPVGHVPPEGRGRFVALELTEPEGVSGPVVSITLKAEPDAPGR
jgi:hypothetical protein